MRLSIKHLEKVREIYALTDRELEYITLFFLGYSDNAQIAQELNNTLLTAKIHITNIYRKLETSHKLGVVIKILEELKILPFDIKEPPEQVLANFQQKYNLTNREIDLVKILCKSVTSNKGIGKEMNLSFRTSINYLKNIYKKTFTNNKLALFLKFIEESK